MLDDDFKQIEDFLKAGGNSELQLFQQFENIVNDFIDNKFKDNAKEGFEALNRLLYDSHGSYTKNADDVIKDFAITIVIIKQLLIIMKDIKDNNLLNEEDQKMYMTLIKVLVEILNQEAKSNLNFFTIYSEYLDGINSLLSFED